jgi:hypothetical protein
VRFRARGRLGEPEGLKEGGGGLTPSFNRLEFSRELKSQTGGGGLSVPEDAWYYADVVYVVENGLMNGVSSTSFGPNAPMTRGMLVTVLHRFLEAAN